MKKFIVLPVLFLMIGWQSVNTVKAATSDHSRHLQPSAVRHFSPSAKVASIVFNPYPALSLVVTMNWVSVFTGDVQVQFQSDTKTAYYYGSHTVTFYGLPVQPGVEQRITSEGNWYTKFIWPGSGTAVNITYEGYTY